MSPSRCSRRLGDRLPVAPRRWMWPGVLLGTLAAMGPVRAEPPVGPLGLQEVARLAATDQPLTIALEARARGAREAAISAAQLPDPELVTGVADVPVETGDAGSLRRESDTQLQLGVVQEFPREAKRRLRSALEVREAERLEAEVQLSRRSIVRDASLAWVEFWRSSREAELTRSNLHEAEAQMELAEIALRAGTMSQADFLSARQEVGRLQDAETGAEQSVAHARNRLSRWIGEDASREVQAELPPLPRLPPLNDALSRVARHPVLATSQADVASARTRLELAHAAYEPDWRVELGYANRLAYADEVTVKVGIDLPFFTHERQDRDVAAAIAREDAAQSLVADARRQLESEARLNHHDFERLIDRLQAYDRTLLPQGDARITAAAAGWRSGRGQFRDVLDARRALLEVRVMRLDLERDLLEHAVQLTYLGVFDAAEGLGGLP